MVWYAWAVVIGLALTVGARIALVGEPKKPSYYTAGEALNALIFNGLAIWAVIVLATS